MKKLNALLLSVLIASTFLLAFAVVPKAKAIFKPELFVSPSVNEFAGPCVVSTEFDVSVKIFNQATETGIDVYAFSFELWWLNSTYYELEDGGHWYSPGSIKTAMIDLVNYEIKSPWPEGSYFIIKDELNLTGIWRKFIVNRLDMYSAVPAESRNMSGYWNYYKFAITALDTTPGLSEIKAPVVDFTFHIADEPLFAEWVDDYYYVFGNSYAVPPNPVAWPVPWFTPFHFENSHISYLGPYRDINEAEAIFEDGYFGILPRMPEMWLQSDKPWDMDQDGDTDYWYTIKWTAADTFTVEVRVRRVAKMYSFHIVLEYNGTLIKTDLQSIHIKDMFPPPYSSLTQNISVLCNDPWTNPTVLEIEAVRPCNKPPICASGALVNIEFKTLCPTTPKQLPLFPYGVYTLPQTAISNITLVGATVDSKRWNPDTLNYVTVTYGYGSLGPGTVQYPLRVRPPQLAVKADGTPAPKPSPLNFVTYYFIPKVEDLDQSGHVDIIDLSAIAKQYGKTASQLDAINYTYAIAFAQLDDYNGNGVSLPVDLFDVVRVAKWFCKSYTPLDPHTGLPYDP